MSDADEWTIWTRCDQCRHLEGWVVRDQDFAFVIPPCELCGSDEITLSDYDPPRRDAA